MNKIILLIIFTLITIIKTKAQVYVDTFGSTVVHIKTLIDSSYFINTVGDTSSFSGDFPGSWDLHWGPDNKLWFSNHNRIERYDPNTAQVKTLLKSKYTHYILGITTHKDFINKPYVYAVVDTQGYYWGTINDFNFIRYTYDPIADSLKDETFLLSWRHVSEHSGGRTICGQDGKIYVSTSEYWFEDDSLFYNSGKILRLNYDGTLPNDNPRADYTYSYGHRVPQGLVQVPNGNIISSEYGQVHDELNLIKKNKNYGWMIGWQNPQSSGAVLFDGYYAAATLSAADSALWVPQVTFPMDVGINPPSGIDYYNHPAIPEFNGIIEAVTGTGMQGIIAYGMNSNFDSVISKKRYLISRTNQNYSAYGRIRDVCSGPSGEVYFIGGDRGTNPSINVIYNPLFLASLVQQDLNNKINIYPNPTNGIFTIKMNNLENTQFHLIDQTGRIIKQGEIINKETTLDLQSFSNGIYFIKLKTDEGTLTYKLTKNN